MNKTEKTEEQAKKKAEQQIRLWAKENLIPILGAILLSPIKSEKYKMCGEFITRKLV